MVRNANYLSIKRPTYQAGTILCAATPTYPVAGLGEVYTIGEAGFIGGAGGLAVVASDFIVALVDTPAGTQAAVGSNWNLTQPEMDMSDLQVTGTSNFTDLHVSGSTTLVGRTSGDYLYFRGGQFNEKLSLDNPNGYLATIKVDASGIGANHSLTLRAGAWTDQTISLQHWDGSDWATIAHSGSSGFVVDGQLHLSTASLTVGASTGWTGTFALTNGLVVSVTNGIITDVS